VGIAVLGPLTIEGDHGTLARRDRVVLAALAVRPGEVVTAEQLADAVWPETLPASWSKVVQGCVMRLRKVLGAHAIETVPAGYRLAVALDQIDAQRFERAVGRARELLAAGDPERAGVVLAEALALWRGQPLAELDTWDPARIEAARLTELRHAADELYVESALRSGHHEEVLAKAEALVIEAPLRERRWVLLATAQYQSGQQGEALRTIRRLRTVLGRELGLDPSRDVDTLEQAILRQDPSLVVESALPEPSLESPYRGLMPYDVDDADIFYGREAEVAACLRRLTDQSVLAVVGPSGCGKSSLVRAGVAASLRRDGRQVVVMTPGPHPLAALAAAMPASGPAPALVVDQCEEVFSLCKAPKERSRFLIALTALATSTPLILSLRADLLADVTVDPEFARTVERGLYLLSGMTEADLRTAIEQPARLASLQVEPGLVDLLVTAVTDQPGALPLMSHTLAETWKRREGRVLTVAGYNASGGIRGAVAQSAEHAFEQVPAERRAVLRDLFLRLVIPGPEGADPVCSRVPRRQVVTSAADDAMINVLVESRLVTSDADMVQLAHESLARSWPRLQGWLDDDRDGQRILHHLASAADSWNSLGRPDSELYRGARLAQALDWRTRTTPTLTQVEQDFIAAGKRLSEAELRAAEDRARQQSRINRRLRAALGAGAFALVAALVAGAVAVRQGNLAQEAATSELARGLGAQSLVTKDISQSVLLAAQGVRFDDTAETRAHLVAAMNRHPQLVRSIPAPSGRTENVEASPDGNQIVSGDNNATVRMYDATSGAVLHSFAFGPAPANTQIYTTPRFSPDGRLVAAIAGDQYNHPVDPSRPLELLSAATLRPVGQQLAIPPGDLRFTNLAFSGNSRYLAAAVQEDVTYSDLPFSSAGYGLVWDLKAPERQPDRIPFPDGYQRIALSPDGRTIYCAARPYTIYILPQPIPRLTAFDVATRRPLWQRTDASGFAQLAITTDGERLAGQVSGSNGAAVLDARTGNVLKTFPSPADPPSAFAFSHRNSLLATAEQGGEIDVWDIATATERLRLQTGEVSWGVWFSRDDGTLYTAGDAGILRVYDLTGQRQYLQHTTVAPPRHYLQVVPSPDGAKTAYMWRTGQDWWVGVTDSATGKMTPPTRLRLNRVDTPPVWRPDGRQFAIHDQATMEVIDAQTGQITARQPFGDYIQNLTYVDQGRRFLVSSLLGVSYLDSALRLYRDFVFRWTSDCCPIGSPDGQRVVIFTNVGDNSRQHWREISTSADEVLREGDLPPNLSDASYSPNGQMIAGISEYGEVLTVDLRSGQARRAPVSGHSNHGLFIRFSPDGQRLVSAAADGTVSYWDANTLDLLGTVTVPTTDGKPIPVSPVFSGGHDIITIAAYDGTAYRWDTRFNQTFALACTMAGRNLTPAEWAAAFGTRPYEQTCRRPGVAGLSPFP
jgi:DNA-binding SARP family transcriptional activator/WD40 repeat protein